MSAHRRAEHLVERAAARLGDAAAPGLWDAPAPALARPAVAVAAGSPQRASPVAAPPAAAVAISLLDLQRAGLAATPGAPRSRITEEIRVVQHQVLRLVRAAGAADARSRIVLVTSTRPGEGKTFMALNVAASLAASGAQPAVLVDADGKRGSVSDLLGVGAASGLCELAADPTAAPASLLLATAIERLLVLPHGRLRATGAGALSAAIERLAAALPDRVIVLDTPPCLSTSDPSTLASIAGQVLMVVQAERTARHEVEAALDLVEGCPQLQLVLNRVRLTSGDSFGAYAYAYAEG